MIINIIIIKSKFLKYLLVRKEKSMILKYDSRISELVHLEPMPN